MKGLLLGRSRLEAMLLDEAYRIEKRFGAVKAHPLRNAVEELRKMGHPHFHVLVVPLPHDTLKPHFEFDIVEVD